MRLLLDTTVLIDVLRGVQPAAARLRGLDARPFVSAISVEELHRGMRQTERRATEDLLEWAIVAPVGPEEARLSGSWRRAYAAKGVHLTQADTLIAASALLRRARLATANLRDFPMPELTVEHWPKGA